jgi:hypothetical protein
MADMAPEELDGYVALFADDARWEMPGSLRQGRDDSLAGALDRRKNGIQGPGTNTRQPDHDARRPHRRRHRYGQRLLHVGGRYLAFRDRPFSALHLRSSSWLPN